MLEKLPADAKHRPLKEVRIDRITIHANRAFIFLSCIFRVYLWGIALCPVL